MGDKNMYQICEQNKRGRLCGIRGFRGVGNLASQWSFMVRS